MVRRGEIWWAELPEPLNSEPGYKRPLLVIQSNEFNKSRINTVIAAVITTNTRLAAAPGNILLSAKKSKLPEEIVINVSRIITIDKSFLAEKVHTLSRQIMVKVGEGVRLVLRL